MPTVPTFPPISVGIGSADTPKRVEHFYTSVAAIFEAWVGRRRNGHIQRAYRQDVMAFVRFVGVRWPNEAWQLYRTSVAGVQAFRDKLIADGAAPKTINRRISSLSSFYKYLAAATQARQLLGLPAADSVLDARDRAISNFYLYTGARLSTGCRLKVSDFHQDGDEGVCCTRGDDPEELYLYTPHSLRATTATFFLDAGGDICKVQELLCLGLLVVQAEQSADAAFIYRPGGKEREIMLV